MGALPIGRTVIAGCFLFWAWLRMHKSPLRTIPGTFVWLWSVENTRPDLWDLAGAAVSLAGAAVILFAPHNR